MKPLHPSESASDRKRGEGVAGSEGAPDCAQAAEYIGLTLVDLARQARTAGLVRLAYLLEAAALEAVAGFQRPQGKAASTPRDAKSG